MFFFVFCWGSCCRNLLIREIFICEESALKVISTVDIWKIPWEPAHSWLDFCWKSNCKSLCRRRCPSSKRLFRQLGLTNKNEWRFHPFHISWNSDIPIWWPASFPLHSFGSQSGLRAENSFPLIRSRCLLPSPWLGRWIYPPSRPRQKSSWG